MLPHPLPCNSNFVIFPRFSLWLQPPIVRSVYQSSLLQLVSTLLFFSPSFLYPFLQYAQFILFSVLLYIWLYLHVWLANPFPLYVFFSNSHLDFLLGLESSSIIYFQTALIFAHLCLLYPGFGSIPDCWSYQTFIEVHLEFLVCDLLNNSATHMSLVTFSITWKWN
jgi:hypothetical protein